MNIIIIFLCIALIGKVKTKNEITTDQCDLEEIINNLKDSEFKQNYSSDTGSGILNWIMGRKDVTPFMSNANLQQLCYCAFIKLHSYTGEKQSIQFENRYYYCRVPCYLSFQSCIVISTPSVKCTNPVTQQNFFLTETDKVYSKKYTRDLFALELSEDEQKNYITQGNNKYYINYPAGKFIAMIPRIDLSKIA